MKTRLLHPSGDSGSGRPHPDSSLRAKRRDLDGIWGFLVGIWTPHPDSRCEGMWGALFPPSKPNLERAPAWRVA